MQIFVYSLYLAFYSIGYIGITYDILVHTAINFTLLPSIVIVTFAPATVNCTHASTMITAISRGTRIGHHFWIKKPTYLDY